MNQGVRGTGLSSTESRLIRDVTPSIAQLEPDAAPLTHLLIKLAMKKASDPKVEWFEDELNPRFDALGADLTDSAGTMTVTNYKRFRAGDLVKVNKAEVVRVSATPTTTTVSIVRSIGATVAAAATSADQLFILSSAHAEGTGKRDLLSTQRVPKFNYCQIFKTPFGVTETQKNTDLYGGQDLAEERQKKLIEHKRDIEQSILFGEKGIDTSTFTHPIRYAGGAQEFISTNVKGMGGEMTEEEFEDFLRLCFRYGSKEKIVLCSPLFIQVVNGYGRAKLQTKSDESTYGVTMTQYQNAGRKVMLIEHVLFTNDALTDLTGVAGYGMLLDIKDLQLRFLRGQMVGYEQNIQAPDEDQQIDQYLSEVTLEMRQEKKHGLATGVTS